MNGPGAYETYDLVLAAYLVAGDVCRLIDIRSSGNGRKLFQFSPSPTKEDLVRFYSGAAHVSARRFAEAFATLKGSGYTMREFA
jgi:hypothetical protein